MPNEPTEFRDRLLDAQPMTPGLREEYRKQLDGLLTHKLSPLARLVNGALPFLWIGFAVALVWSAIAHPPTPSRWINLGIYFAVFVWLAFGNARNAWKGEHTWRSYFRVAGAFYGAAGITVVLTLLQGLKAPHDPASTFSAIYALVFLIVCLGWALQNRIDAALLTTRENMLRIESRLVDLSDRLPK